MANKNLIDKHNSENHSYTLELNHFADRTWEELRNKYLKPLENVEYPQCVEDDE